MAGAMHDDVELVGRPFVDIDGNSDGRSPRGQDSVPPSPGSDDALLPRSSSVSTQGSGRESAGRKRSWGGSLDELRWAAADVRHVAEEIAERTTLLGMASFEVLQDSNVHPNVCPMISPVGTRAPSATPPTSHLVPASHLPDPAQMEELFGQLSVLTLNVWAKRAVVKIQEQVEGVRLYDPDVICLQEVFHLHVLESYRAAFPDYVLVAAGRQLTWLATGLFILWFVALPTAICSVVVAVMCRFLHNCFWLGVSLWPVIVFLNYWPFRDHYFVAFLVGNQTGLAMLIRRNKFDLAMENGSCVNFSYPDGHAEDGLNCMRARGYIVAAGTIPLKGGRTSLKLRVATTHLNQPTLQPKGRGRHQQVRELLEGCLHPGELLVLAGDFNATPPGTEGGTQCNTYQEITAWLSDAWADVNAGDPAKDGLTWDQEGNPYCVSATNSLLYGTTPLRWRCDFVLWRQSRPEERYHEGRGGQNGDGRPGVAEVNGRSLADEVEVQVRSCDTVLVGDDAVSDHYAVLATFDILRRPAGSRRSERARKTLPRKECLEPAHPFRDAAPWLDGLV
eukprot:TRINITY_DN15150_c0_g1_i1.p1 TRINITY_DN15150_c0_g1~~TRINITY_DN15150_c0_g1_i1.p1  ORF type:complete len:573 (+),score=76.14 TRINITY_DN15150_c0_g1_i1:34-1719(+)